jgi:hypothetical protein
MPARRESIQVPKVRLLRLGLKYHIFVRTTATT